MLTQREKYIITGLVNGRTHQEIGDEIGKAKRTIDDNIQDMFKKYNVRNSCQLVSKAIMNKWLD